MVLNTSIETLLNSFSTLQAGWASPNVENPGLNYVTAASLQHSSPNQDCGSLDGLTAGTHAGYAANFSSYNSTGYYHNASDEALVYSQQDKSVDFGLHRTSTGRTPASNGLCARFDSSRLSFSFHADQKSPSRSSSDQ